MHFSPIPLLLTGITTTTDEKWPVIVELLFQSILIGSIILQITFFSNASSKQSTSTVFDIELEDGRGSDCGWDFFLRIADCKLK